MSERKLVGQVASGSGGQADICVDFLNNIFGDIKDEIEGRLVLGPTTLDITEGLKVVKQKNNDDDNDANEKQYTIMLNISRGAINSAVQFLEIKSKLTEKEILYILFEHLKYKLPISYDEPSRLNKRKRKDGTFWAHKYFEIDGEFHCLVISRGHAYIYIGESDGKYYKNSFSGASDFIFRNDPDGAPNLCSII